MMSPEEWKRRGRDLAEAAAPVVGIALKCESGDGLGMDAAAAKACLEPSVVYFRSKNKEALATSIERLIDALDQGTDVQVRGAEVMQSLNASYPQ
jgi:hypothetical protein